MWSNFRREQTERSWTWVVLVCAVLAWMPALASDASEDPAPDARAEAGADAPEDRDLTEYVEVNSTFLPTSNTIATKLPVPLQLTPANVGSVTAPLIREQGAVVLGDALRNVSGLNVQSGTGVHDFFVIRGFDSLSSGLVMTDGAWEPEVTYYPMYNVEGIEVLKAPGGFLYGPNPLAGVVNIVRKQPMPNDFGTFTAAIGSFDTVEGALDWNRSNDSGTGSFRLNGTWRESDNYRDDKDSRLWAVNPSFTWRPDGDTTINLNLEYASAEFRPDTGLPLSGGEIPDVPRKRSYQTPADFSDQALVRFQVDVDRRISDVLSLRNKMYYRDLDWRTNGTIFNGVILNPLNNRLTVLRTLTLLDDRQKFVGNQFEAVLELDMGAVRHHLLAGVEVARLSDDFSAGFVPPPDPANPGFPSVAPIDLLDPVETFDQVGGTLPLSAGDSRSVIVAPYVVDQIDIAGRYQIMVGARYDDIDFEDDVNGVRRDDSKLSPMVGFTWAPNERLSLYGNGGKSFAPASPRAVGEFEPEESTQYEVGVKKRWLDGRIRTNLAVFDIDRENIAILDDNGITQQAGDQTAQGFEVELAAEPRPRLRTFLAYAYTDAELTRFTESDVIGFDPMSGAPIFGTVDRSGNAPAFAPEHLANLWVGYTFRGGFGLGGGARYIGEQFIDEDNAFRIDAAVVLDATAYYDFDAWRVNVHVFNLTDEEYETRGFGSNSVTPADGLSVRAGVEYRF